MTRGTEIQDVISCEDCIEAVHGSLTDVGSFGGKLNAAPAINDVGQITGYSQDWNGNLLAFMYARKQSEKKLKAAWVPMSSSQALEALRTMHVVDIRVGAQFGVE